MPVVEPGEASASISVIFPALLLAEQSIQVLPWLALKPSTGWLNTLNASMRNCAFSRSVTLKFFISDGSEVNERGPYMMLRPAEPRRPKPGSTQAPPNGCGVKNVTQWFTTSSEPGPTGKAPVPRSGRQTPTSSSLPQTDVLGVQGKPLLQLVVVLSSQPPMTVSRARPALAAKLFPRPKGSW